MSGLRGGKKSFIGFKTDVFEKCHWDGILIENFSKKENGEENFLENVKKFGNILKI